MTYTHPMYVCERCGWGHYHPLSYCVRCPGKLIRREIIHSEHKEIAQSKEHLKKLEQKHREELAQQGVIYTGEYPKVDPKLELQNQLWRYKEKLLVRQLECIFNHTNNLNRGLHPDRSVTFWIKEILQLEEKLKELTNVTS